MVRSNWNQSVLQLEYLMMRYNWNTIQSGHQLEIAYECASIGTRSKVGNNWNS